MFGIVQIGLLASSALAEMLRCPKRLQKGFSDMFGKFIIKLICRTPLIIIKKFNINGQRRAACKTADK